MNIAPKGIITLAVSWSKIFRKSTPNSELNVNRLNDIDTTVVVMAAAILESFNSSEKYAVSTSWNDIVDVSEASITRKKNIADHKDAKGMPLNISGNVTKISEGPSVGCRPALNTAGNITRPASTDTNSVRSDTLNEVVTRLLLFLKYDAYVTMHPIPTDSEKNACPIAIMIVSVLNASLKSHERKKR